MLHLCPQALGLLSLQLVVQLATCCEVLVRDQEALDEAQKFGMGMQVVAMAMDAALVFDQMKVVLEQPVYLGQQVLEEEQPE